MNLENPTMREELVWYVTVLSDKDFQRKRWVETGGNSFDFSVHFLFDDTQLASNPEKYIGYILKDEEEAKAVQELCQAIDEIFDEYGTNLSDATYISLPEWNSVIEAARRAKTLIAPGSPDNAEL